LDNPLAISLCTGEKGQAGSESGGLTHAALEVHPPPVVDDKARLARRVQVVGSAGKAEDDDDQDEQEQDEQPHYPGDDAQNHDAIVAHDVAKRTDANRAHPVAGGRYDSRRRSMGRVRGGGSLSPRSGSAIIERGICRQ